MPTFEGKLIASEMRFGIVVSRFNELMTKQLLSGALETLRRFGLDESAVTVVWVPGAFEIPLIAQKLAESQEMDAVICLGVVIRGETPHFDYVCSTCASGISRVSLETGIPVIFGVLTTETIDQALSRCGSKAGNKGSEAAQTAIEMASLVNQLDNKSQAKRASAKALN